MKTTHVLELNSREDVRAFCTALLKAKELAPVSVTFTIAVTVHRVVTPRPTMQANGVVDPIGSIFADIDPDPVVVEGSLPDEPDRPKRRRKKRPPLDQRGARRRLRIRSRQ